MWWSLKKKWNLAVLPRAQKYIDKINLQYKLQKPVCGSYTLSTKFRAMNEQAAIMRINIITKRELRVHNAKLSD